MGGGEGVTDWRLRWPTCYSSRQRGRGYTGGGEGGVTDRREEGGTWEGERG